MAVPNFYVGEACGDNGRPLEVEVPVGFPAIAGYTTLTFKIARPGLSELSALASSSTSTVVRYKFTAADFPVVGTYSGWVECVKDAGVTVDKILFTFTVADRPAPKPFIE